jgi:hypothetical protein
LGSAPRMYLRTRTERMGLLAHHGSAHRLHYTVAVWLDVLEVDVEEAAVGGQHEIFEVPVAAAEQNDSAQKSLARPRRWASRDTPDPEQERDHAVARAAAHKVVERLRLDRRKLRAARARA